MKVAAAAWIEPSLKVDRVDRSTYLVMHHIVIFGRLTVSRCTRHELLLFGDSGNGLIYIMIYQSKRKYIKFR